MTILVKTDICSNNIASSTKYVQKLVEKLTY